MGWYEISGRDWGDEIRHCILTAIRDAYDENSRRYAPDDLGDNNMTFGVNVSQNLRFLLAHAVADLPGIEVERPRGSFVLVLWGRVVLHFYKAPPGVVDVRDLRFDESKTKLELLAENADQLALEFDEPEFVHRPELRHAVVIHFGDPIGGLSHVEVGAPFASPVNGHDWEWVESLSDPPAPALDGGDPADHDEDSEEADEEDFDLRLRDDPDEDQIDDTGGS